jgi:hypothetical protein
LFDCRDEPIEDQFQATNEAKEFKLPAGPLSSNFHGDYGFIPYKRPAGLKQGSRKLIGCHDQRIPEKTLF